jgi:hypothetical protein
VFETRGGISEAILRTTLAVFPLVSAVPQETTLQGFEHWTATDLGRVAQALNFAAASDPHHFAVKQLADFPNEAFLLVHGEADGQVEWNETQIDIFFVQSGFATLLVGGTLSVAKMQTDFEIKSFRGGL